MRIARSKFKKEVLVITFYKEQRERLENEYKARYLTEYAINPEVNIDNQLRIMTVDACQGTEADWVILSTVRCNRQKSIGFLRNKNRVNVAISRAREKLIIVGSKATLRCDKTWDSVVAKAENARSVQQLF